MRAVGRVILQLFFVVVCAWVLVQGVQKILEPESLRNALAEQSLLPGILERSVANTLPWIEIAVAFAALALAVVGEKIRAAMLLCGMLFALFAAYLWIAHFVGASGKAGCGCGLNANPVQSWWPLATAETAVAAILLWGGIVGFSLLTSSQMGRGAKANGPRVAGSDS